MSTPIRIAKLKPEPSRAQWMVDNADDIARLRYTLASAGILADDETIFDAWRRHSDEHAASWLILYPSDDDNLVALMKHIDLD